MKIHAFSTFFLFAVFLLTAKTAPGQTVINSLPYGESFESGTGGWNNVSGDDIDWSRYSGPTPSASTGPSSAYEGSYYYYIEASSPNYPSKTAYLMGPQFDFTDYESVNFSFYYHMYGSAMGTLVFQVSTDNGATWQTKWNKGGNQTNSWYSAIINLDSYAGQSVKIRFGGTTGTSYTGDIAIDKITVTGVPAPTVQQVSVSENGCYESFESYPGTWINDGADDFDWTRITGNTPSGNTGPSVASDGNYYYYIEASSPNYPNKKAWLRGPDFTFDITGIAATMTFSYHMYGDNIGTLALEASTDQGNTWTEIWSKSGDQNNGWNSQTINLNQYINSGVSLRFRGTTGSGYAGDIAVDDIKIETGSCGASATPGIFENFVHVTTPLTESGPCGESMQTIQYFDGLGRQVQTVQYGASPNREDIITSLGYDAYGRQHKSYLPFEAPGNNGQFYEDFTNVANYTASYGATDDDYAFSETIFEPSPLNRVERQRPPGYAWRDGQNREVKSGYGSNAAGEVYLLTVSFLLDTLSGAPTDHYAAGELYKNTTWDENQTGTSGTASRVEEFKDKLDRVVCKKVFNDTDEHATYYVYDDFGNLRYVVQPKVILDNGISPAELKELCFQYTYDERQRMITKKVPGAAPVYMVYDQRDRLVLTQDGVQRTKSPKEWTFTKYDQLNRPVMTGIYQSNSTHTNLQTTVMGKTGNALYETFGTGYTHGYSNNSFPTSGIKEILTVTYYDNYAFKSLSGYDGKFEFDYANGINNDPYMSKPKGMATGGKTKVLNDGTWLLSATYYDDKLRAIQGVSETYGGKYARTSTEYDFTGNVIETKTVYVMDDDSEEQVRERFEYDHANRLINAWHSVAGQPEVLMAKNEYDAIGRLTDKKLHSADGGNTFDQSIDYRYNIRGWLTGINNAARSNDGVLNDDTNDLFGMELSYEASPAGLSFTSQYNGNISGMRWSDGYHGARKSYGFEYDGLNRIRGASYKEIQGGAWEKAGYFDIYDVTYDKNGNIETLRRNENNDSIDNLSYLYHAMIGNRLKSVNDLTNNARGFRDGAETSDEYGYDQNGNMISDDNKGITNITYNMLNLPELIGLGNNRQIEYVYDASGTKWRKVVTDNGTAATTDYVGNMILEDGRLKLMHTAEGRIVADTAGQGYTYRYQYYLKDHLGHVRVTFGVEPDTTTYTATMESENASEEGQYFDNIDGMPGTGLNTTPGGNEVLVLDGSEQTGGNFTEKVLAGDVIDIEVQAAYESGSNYSNTTGFAAMVTGIAAGFGGVSGAGGESGLIYDAINNALGLLGLGGSQGNDQPAAYLNYLVFDDDMNYQFGGYTDVSGNSSGTMQQFSITNINITKSGYIYVYLSNESTAQENAFFDDLKITHTSNLTIVQADDYYPFGLSFNSYNDTTETKQKFLYNGKELQKDLDLDWYDFHARQYMADLGRTTTMDPMAEKFYSMSQYSMFANNPVRYVDPTGMEFTESAWDWVNSLIANINQQQERNNNKISKKQAQLDAGGLKAGKAKRLNRQINRLNAANKSLEVVRGEIATLAASDQVYNVNEISSSSSTTTDAIGNSTITASTSFNSTTNAVDINISSNAGLGLFAHELKHAYQFDQGQLSLGSFGIKSPGYFLYDKQDEYEGYARQGMFGTTETSLPSIYDNLPTGPIDINNYSYKGMKLNQMNVYELQRLSKHIMKQAFRYKVNGVWKTFHH